VHEASGRPEVASSYTREALRIAEHAGDATTAARCRATLHEPAFQALPLGGDGPEAGV
jgi:hypothetical protein